MLLRFILSLFFCWIRFIRIDPLKRALNLIVSTIFGVVYFRIFFYSWFRYFVILVFLRGVFSILLYVSRLSSLDYKTYSVSFIILFVFPGFLLLSPVFNYYSVGVKIYFFRPLVIYLFWFFFIIFLLLFFLRVFFNFKGALRKF